MLTTSKKIDPLLEIFASGPSDNQDRNEVVKSPPPRCEASHFMIQLPSVAQHCTSLCSFYDPLLTHIVVDISSGFMIIRDMPQPPFLRVLARHLLQERPRAHYPT